MSEIQSNNKKKRRKTISSLRGTYIGGYEEVLDISLLSELVKKHNLENEYLKITDVKALVEEKYERLSHNIKNAKGGISSKDFKFLSEEEKKTITFKTHRFRCHYWLPSEIMTEIEEKVERIMIKKKKYLKEWRKREKEWFPSLDDFLKEFGGDEE